MLPQAPSSTHPRPLEAKPGNGEWRLGVQLDYRTPNGSTRHETVRLSRFQLHLPHRHAHTGVCQQTAIAFARD